MHPAQKDFNYHLWLARNAHNDIMEKEGRPLKTLLSWGRDAFQGKMRFSRLKMKNALFFMLICALVLAMPGYVLAQMAVE